MTAARTDIRIPYIILPTTETLSLLQQKTRYINFLAKWWHSIYENIYLLHEFNVCFLNLQVTHIQSHEYYQEAE